MMTTILYCALFSILVLLGLDTHANPSLTARLQAQSSQSVTIKRDAKTQKPYWIKGSFAYDHSLSKKKVAKQFVLKSFIQGATKGPKVSASVHHGRAQNDDFIVRKTVYDSLKRNTIVRLQQTVNTIPIFGSDIGVHVAPNNHVQLMVGHVVDADIDTTPVISAEEATNSARDHLKHTSEQVGQTELTIYAYQTKPTLSWHVVLRTQQ